MPNANNHQEHASSVPQSTELNSTVSAAPRHEQTTVSSYPVLPGRDQQPTYPSVAYVPTVVGQPQPVVVQLVPQSPPVGPASTSLTCPSCKALISTKVNYAPSVKTHVIALILCLVGCWCCVCCPYCIDNCQNANHMCPSCGAHIGTYDHMKLK